MLEWVISFLSQSWFGNSLTKLFLKIRFLDNKQNGERLLGEKYNFEYQQKTDALFVANW